MGYIFIGSFILLFAVSFFIACQISPEQDKKNMDDAWWLLTGQEPVNWESLGDE